MRQPDFSHFAKNYFSRILSLKNKFILQNETVVLVLCLRFSWYHAYMGTQTPEYIHHSIVKKKNVQNISPGNLIMLIYFFTPCQDTALHLAAKNGHAAIVTYLLSHDSQNVTYNAYNQNALDVAIEAGKEPVVMCIGDHLR